MKKVAFTLALLPVILALSYTKGTAQLSTPSPSRKLFSGSVVNLSHLTQRSLGLNVAAVTPSNPIDLTQRMELHFWLQTPHIAELKARVSKGELISDEEMRNKYSGSAKRYNDLLTWLELQGFEITAKTPDRTSVYASATIGQIEKSLQVHMVKVTYQGVTYVVANTPPSLPADIGASVSGIDGLQPFLRANRHIIWFRPPAGQISAPRTERPAMAGFGANVANSAPYLVSEVLKEYNAANLPYKGKGETIGILIDTLPADGDLQAFWRINKLGVTLSQIEKVNVAGHSLPPPQGEETLDVEWSSGIAPEAIIRVYAAGSTQFLDLDKALDRITTDLQNEPNLHQLSISLGLGETFMNKDEVAAEDTRFARLAALGVNTLVSSGDAGSNPDSTGQSSSGPLQVEFQSSDPFLIAVGGTTLQLDPLTEGVATETAWSDSGGGISSIFSRPAWQSNVETAMAAMRLVPDVSSAADPNMGALIVFNGQQSKIGGTSWSAPTWAGFCALINEARKDNGSSQLPFLNPLIYPLLGTDAFRDITVGNNGQYDAGPGFDLVTGLGTPNVGRLLAVLQNTSGGNVH
jgi:kumamolisin